MEDALIAVKQVDLTNDKHLTVVTTIESLFPVILSVFLYSLFGFFLILTLLKKFSLSSLLKCLAVLLIIMSFFQPWWLFTGSSDTVPAEKTTALYINPGMMIETINYYGEISLNIAEMPDIFIMFLGAMLPVASLACFCLALGVILKKIQKRNYALILSIIAVVLLCFLLSSFYMGTTKLTETSIGVVQGEEVLTTSIGSEDILLQSSWGFSSGFYLVFFAILVAALSLILDIRTRVMQKRKSLSLRS
jgi:type III secretory pathway component EscS